MGSKLVIAFFLFLTITAEPAKITRAVECERLASSLLDPPTHPRLSLEHQICGESYVVSLHSLLSVDAKGYPTWKLLDKISITGMRRFEEVHDTICSRNGTDDSDLVALGARVGPHELRNVRRAWKIDRRQGRFREVSTAGIRCTPYYPGGHEDEWWRARRQMEREK